MILRWLSILFGLTALVLATGYSSGWDFTECRQVATDLAICELRAPVWVLQAAILCGIIGVGCLVASWWRHERRGDSPWV